MQREMQINKTKIAELRKEYGDAFYLLDSGQFRNNFIELKDTFRKIYPNFNIAYSYKTNYTPKFCKIVNELGGYAEVVSEMELEIALRVGVESKRIIWNGPIKNAKKLVQTVSELPLDRILLETDCPYMAPEPHRGTRNDSSNIPYVIKKIAEIKGTTPDEVERMTRANAFELFTRVSD